MINVGPIKDQIAVTESELDNLLPTPPVGTIVVWYERGRVEASAQRAAVVTKQEAPGKLTITVFAPNAMQSHKQGVLHVTHSVHEKAHNSVSKNSGGWDYVEGTKIPESHYKIHLDVVEGKLVTMRAQLAEAERIFASESKPVPRKARAGQAETSEAVA